VSNPVDLKRFDEATKHPYECRCDLCIEWWEDIGWGDADEEWPKCPTCGGRGTVNPLTPNLPQGFLCLSTTDCPNCEGSGECP
jgi:DnaJ-class molecular chaperone